MKKLILFFVLVIAVSANAQPVKTGAFDPSAARSDMSNVQPANVINVIQRAPSGEGVDAEKLEGHGLSSFTMQMDFINHYNGNTEHGTTGIASTAALIDYLKLTGDATFSHTLDVATLTIAGNDVLGDIQSALTEILGN